MTRYLIVDDEPIAHRIIERYCKDLPHLELAGHCYDALQAMQFLSSNPVDLMFLDLNMPKLKGFDFLKTLPHAPKVIVTTAYKEFALEGYELDICDYLLKPFSFERFVKAVNKAISSDPPLAAPPVPIQTTAPSGPQRLFIKGDKKHHQVTIEEISIVEAYGNYTKVHLAEKVLIAHETLSGFEAMLPADAFIRVHKSFLVQIAKIRHIEGNRIKLEDQEVPVGQVYKSNVNRLLGQ